MHRTFARLAALCAAALLAACTPPPARTPSVDLPQAVERGRYLVQISGCNDCHTEEFMEKGGKVPEAEWLKGSRRGWRNEEGTVYATNLRLLINGISEEQWVTMARTLQTRAPMSWYRLRGMSEADLRAIHVFVRWLGPAGAPAPAPLPPEVEPPEPYIFFPAVH